MTIMASLFLFSLSAQKTTTVKVKINQADALELDASGEPETVGDISKFEVKGGTPPYSDFVWEEDSAEEGKTHKVTVTDSTKCTVSIYVNVLNFNDIEEIVMEGETAHPNPTSDIVKIPVPANEKSVTLLIINESGMVLYKNKVTPEGSWHRLSLSSCPAGRYYIQVISKGKTKTYSIIKKNAQ